MFVLKSDRLLENHLAHVWRRLHVVREHWPTIGAVAALSIITTWFVSNLVYVQQIDVLKNHNSFLQDRLNVFQQNQAAAAATPPSQWRRLSDRERGLLFSALKQPEQRPRVIVIYAMADSEPRQYAAQFVDVFRTFDIDVRAREVPLSMVMADVGLMVGVTNFSNPSDEARKFMDILRSAGLQVHYTLWTKVTGLDDSPVDFDLFIGPKPW